MSDIARAREALLARILDGDGAAPREQRRAAFANHGLAAPLRSLVDKVANHAYRVTDRDIAAATSAGLSENEVFELVVCAAVGQADRQYEAALSALDTATQEG